MKNKSNQIVNNMIMIGVPILLILIWEIAGKIGWMNQSIMPVPTKIGETIRNLMIKGTLQKNLMISFKRVVIGFVYGTVAGIILGILMGQFEKVNKAFTVIVGVLRPIPMIGWTPLFILWMGLGETSKIAIIAVSSFWSVLVNTIDGIKGVDNKYLEVASLFEKNKLSNIKNIILPSISPSIFTGIRLGFGNAWRGVVAAEMIASTAGIGYMVSSAREMAQPAVLLVGLLTIGLVCLFIDTVILWIQKKIFVWNG